MLGAFSYLVGFGPISLSISHNNFQSADGLGFGAGLGFFLFIVTILSLEWYYRSTDFAKVNRQEGVLIRF